MRGVIFITTLSNTQKSEVFLLRISSGYVNASGVATLSSNLLKKSSRETSLFMFTVIGAMEKVFC